MIPEMLVLNHLASQLSVPVRMEKDPSMMAEYVHVERIGGSVVDHIRSVSFAIQSIAPSLLKACELNERVKEAMERLIESDHVSRIVLDSDYNFTDTATKQYRYQAVYDLWLFD